MTELPLTSQVLPNPVTPQEYYAKYRAAVLKPTAVFDLAQIKKGILKNLERYDTVSHRTQVPWDVIACIHSLESDLNFRTYLQNGDPLFDRGGRPIQTTHEPHGVGPFPTWEAAACAALPKFLANADDMGAKLCYMETYNGLGYRHMGIASPYLWSWTNQYISGKYVADGRYDAEAISEQAGAAAIMMVLWGD